MEKNNGKIIAIVALVVAVVALSVGFAAFADQLTISAQANVAAPSNPFDDSTNGLAYAATNSAVCYYTGDNTDTTTNAGTASGDTWSGISVPLTADKPSVTCTATVVNNTSYTAYLRSIAASGPVECTSTGANATANASAVCATAQAVVTIDDASLTVNKDSTNSTKNDTITNKTITANGGTKTVTIVISYNPTGVNIDEDVTITIPTITHTYSSAGTGDVGTVAGS